MDPLRLIENGGGLALAAYIVWMLGKNHREILHVLKEQNHTIIQAVKDIKQEIVQMSDDETDRKG